MTDPELIIGYRTLNSDWKYIDTSDLKKLYKVPPYIKPSYDLIDNLKKALGIERHTLVAFKTMNGAVYDVESGQWLCTEPKLIVKEIPESALSIQEGGSHYKSMAIQPVEFITKNSIPYLEGNVIKYVSRHSAKNGIEDIKKAIHYLQLIAELQYAVKLAAPK